MKKRLFVLASLVSMTPALAHHGHDHGTEGGTTTTTVTAAAPVQAPPPPPPPPPVVQAPAPLPQIALPTFVTPLVPTDIAGLGGSLGRAKGLKEQLLGPGGRVDKKVVLIARDPRYEFGGDWIPFTTDKAAEESVVPEGRHVAKVEQWVQAFKTDEPLFMPTATTECKLVGEELVVTSGAVLVRGGNHPCTIVTLISGERVVTRLGNGALALVSNLDGKPTVINLTDRCCGAVVTSLPDETGKHNHVSLGVGEIVEVHRHDDKPFSTYVATKVLSNHQLSQHLKLQVSRAHYISAVRRFNLDHALPPKELKFVLKTAAAMAFVNPGGKH